MLLKIRSWESGRRAQVWPVSDRWDSRLKEAYGGFELNKETRDDWLDFFEVPEDGRKKVVEHTSPWFEDSPWTRFRAAPEDFERALADERGRKYQGVLKGVK